MLSVHHKFPLLPYTLHVGGFAQKNIYILSIHVSSNFYCTLLHHCYSSATKSKKQRRDSEGIAKEQRRDSEGIAYRLLKRYRKILSRGNYCKLLATNIICNFGRESACSYGLRVLSALQLVWSVWRLHTGSEGGKSCGFIFGKIIILAKQCRHTVIRGNVFV